jgi:sulfite exporter TauE/SafE
MAAASGGVTSAALFMAGFGAGTLPALVGLSAWAPRGLSALRSLRRVTPLVLGAIGIILVIRGVLPIPSGHPSQHAAGVHLLHRP